MSDAFPQLARGDMPSHLDWNRVTAAVTMVENMSGVNGIRVSRSGGRLIVGRTSPLAVDARNVRVVNVLNKSGADFTTLQPLMLYCDADMEGAEFGILDAYNTTVFPVTATVNRIFRPPFLLAAEPIPQDQVGLAFCGGIVPAIVKVYKPALDYWFDKYNDEKFALPLRADPMWHTSTVEKTLFGSDCGWRVLRIDQIAADGDASVALIDMDDYLAGTPYLNSSTRTIPPGGIAVVGTDTELDRPGDGDNVSASFINSIYHKLENGYKRNFLNNGGVVLTDQTTVNDIDAGVSTFGLDVDTFKAVLDGGGLIAVRQAFVLPGTSPAEVCCAVRAVGGGEIRVYKAIADASGGSIQVKAVDSTGTAVGDAITLKVLPGGLA